MTNDDMQKALRVCYEKALDGLPISKSVSELGTHYLNKYPSKEAAAKHLINAQTDCKVYNKWIPHKSGRIDHTSGSCSCQHYKCFICSIKNDCIYCIYRRV